MWHMYPPSTNITCYIQAELETQFQLRILCNLRRLHMFPFSSNTQFLKAFPFPSQDNRKKGVISVASRSLILDMSSWECSASSSDRFTSRERPPGIQWTGSCVGPRRSASVRDVNILLLTGIEKRFLWRPGRSLDTTPTELSRRWVSKKCCSVYTLGRVNIETQTPNFTLGFKRIRPDVCCWHQRQGKRHHMTTKRTQILSLHRTSLKAQFPRTFRNRTATQLEQQHAD
jgi:hypothetical protein